MKRFSIILPAGFIAAALLASFFRIGALWGVSAWGALTPLVALIVAIAVSVPAGWRAARLSLAEALRSE